MVSYGQLLGVRSFVLEARSWSGKDVPVNLYQMNVILCSDKNGQGPKAQLPPSEVQVMAERRQIAAGGALRTCPAVIAEGARCPTQLALRLLRPPVQGGPGPTGCDPG